MKAPRIVSDLYRDLRDRRLLPLVVILVVAIPALPVLLTSDSEAPSVTPTDDGALAEAADIPTLPAVLASAPGVRDYRERLETMRSKNPFAQEFQAPDLAGSEVVEVGGGGAATPPLEPTGGGAASGATTAGSAAGAVATQSGATDTASVASATTSTSGSDSGGAAGDGSSGSGSSSDGGNEESPDGSGTQWFTYRIDVVTGRVGDATPRKNVKRLTVLPSQSNPVAMFMSVDEGGERAAFLVSADVVRTHGDGRCIPSPAECQLLTLRRGEKRTFEYAPHGEADTFVIELEDIRSAGIDPKASGSGTGDRGANAANSLKSFLGL